MKISNNFPGGNIKLLSMEGNELLLEREIRDDQGYFVLMCALKDTEVEKFHKEIKDIDENAFIIFSESTKISGNGFKIYK